MSGVKIRVRADAGQAQREIGKLEKSVISLDKRASAVSKSFRNLAIGITAAFTGGALTKSITRSADSMTDFGNRVNLVTRDVQKTKVVMDELFKIAARSRGSVDAAAETFNRFGLALQDANKPVGELLKVTEAVQKAAVISGAGAQSAKAAIVQLGQGLASGQLRGQELNSVLEQMPRLAKSIADGMGIPFGKLREEAMAGKITAEAVYKAILEGAQEIDDEYNTLNATVSGLATVFGNEWTRAIANLDKAIGTSAGIADGIRLATFAVQSFGENIIGYSVLLGGELLLAKLKVKGFARSIGEFFEGIFSGNISAKDVSDKIVNGFSDAKDKVKNLGTIAIDFSVKKIDLLKGMLPGMANAKQRVKVFTEFIKDLFKSLHKAVVGNSYWTGMFDPAHKEPGQTLAIGSSLSSYLNKPKAELTNFGSKISQIFSDLNFEVYDSWLSLTTSVNEIGLKPTVDLGFEKVWNTAIANMSAGYDRLREKALLASGVDPSRVPSASNVSDSVSKLKEDISLKFDNTSQKTLETLSQLGSIIEGTLAFTAGKIVFESVVKSGGATKEFISSLITDLEENKELIGTALSLGIAAGFKLGFARVIGSGLFIFNAKEILNSPAFQASLSSFGQGLGEILSGIFNQTGGDAGESFVIGFRDSLIALGSGILDGIFGQGDAVQVGDILSGATVNESTVDFSGITKGITGGITAAIGLATVSKNVRKALFKMLKIAFIGVGTSMLGLITGALAVAFAVENWDLDIKIANAVDTILEKFLEFLGVESQFARDFTAGFGDTIGLLIQAILMPFKNIGKLVKAAFSEGYTMKDALNDAKDEAKEIFQGFADIIKAPFEAVFDFIENGIKGITASAKEFIFGDGTTSFKDSNLIKRANGGPVNGPGTGTSDDIPAMLSNGEYVMKQSAVQKFGSGFMRSINNGIVPAFRNQGGPIGSATFSTGFGVTGQSNRLAIELARARADGRKGDEQEIIEQLKLLNNLNKAQVDLLEEGGQENIEAALAGTDEDVTKVARSYAENFSNTFAAGLSDLLHGADLKSVLTGLLDSFTSSVIDSFANSFTDGFMENITPLLTSMFEGIGKLGTSSGGKGEDWLGTIINFGSGLFGGPKMFAQGGTVPNVPGSIAGKDSVPAMLMPGEVVLSKNQLRNMDNGYNSGSTQSFNINVQGDVSRQTRHEIVKMMPQIAGGVNAQNKENNFKR
jgi:tape measure domain-containing protein